MKHLLDNTNMVICRALIKYGYSSFRLEIFQYCESNIRIQREFYYIKLYEPDYNIIRLSSSMPNRFGYVHKQSSKSKIRLNQPNRQMVRVKDTITNVQHQFDSYSLAGQFLGVSHGVIHNYFKRNQVKPIKKNFILQKIEKPYSDLPPKPDKTLISNVVINVLNIKTNISQEFPSMRGAARVLGIEHSTIRKHIKLNTPYKDMYLFSVVSKNDSTSQP